MKATACALLASALFGGCVMLHPDTGSRSIEEHLDSIVIPEIEFRQSGPEEAVRYLEAESRERDPNRKGVAIACALSDREMHLSFMSVRSVTLREALNIFCETVGLDWAIEDQRVTVREMSPGLGAASVRRTVNTVTARRNRATEKKLDTITIPEVDFRMADPFCSFTFLEAAARERDPSHQGVSIVYMPTGTNHPSATFTARDTSLREVLNTFCERAKLKWSVEDSVVKVRPKTVQQSSGGDSSTRADAGLGDALGSRRIGVRSR